MTALIEENAQLKDALAEMSGACEASDRENNVLRAENARLRGALERLASSEAFDVSRAIRPGTDDELVARLTFARAALKELAK